MAGTWPLTALLSQAFVAFTIECDNEFERRMSHRTARAGGTGPRREVPWLTSMVMWFTCLRFLTDEGRTVDQIERLARTSTNWNGMERWGYIEVGPDPADSRPRPPRKDWLVRATPAGRRAQAAWAPIGAEVERRWRERFGDATYDTLREGLEIVVGRLDPDLPDCLPILGYGLFSRLPARRPAVAHEADPTATVTAREPLALPCLMARVLLSTALQFEDRWPISLANTLDTLDSLDERGQRLRDLPGRSGVSKEAIAMGLGVLGKGGFVELVPAPGGNPGSVARLTDLGHAVQLDSAARLAELEASWPDRFGAVTVEAVRAALETIVAPEAQRSPLFLGLVPDPHGWRAAIPAPATLPRFPMVLHRGGYPDGS